jgi:hypothetical protein
MFHETELSQQYSFETWSVDHKIRVKVEVVEKAGP